MANIGYYKKRISKAKEHLETSYDLNGIIVSSQFLTGEQPQIPISLRMDGHPIDAIATIIKYENNYTVTVRVQAEETERNKAVDIERVVTLQNLQNGYVAVREQSEIPEYYQNRQRFKDRVGQIEKMRNGLMAQCIEYKHAKDITVQFLNDGAIQKHVYWSDFKKGKISSPTMGRHKKIEHIGETTKQEDGSVAKIVGYKDCNNITIQTEDGRTLDTDYASFARGKAVTLKSIDHKHESFEFDKVYDHGGPFKMHYKYEITDYELLSNMTVTVTKSKLPLTEKAARKLQDNPEPDVVRTNKMSYTEFRNKQKGAFLKRKEDTLLLPMLNGKKILMLDFKDEKDASFLFPDGSFFQHQDTADFFSGKMTLESMLKKATPTRPLDKMPDYDKQSILFRHGLIDIPPQRHDVDEIEDFCNDIYKKPNNQAPEENITTNISDELSDDDDI